MHRETKIKIEIAKLMAQYDRAACFLIEEQQKNCRAIQCPSCKGRGYYFVGDAPESSLCTRCMGDGLIAPL
jgi:hypothetical protein